MSSVTFYFHGDLIDFLADGQRRQKRPFYPQTSVKHAIESIGPPHTEVGGIVINGRGVDFDAMLQPGDAVAVYAWDGAPDTAVPLRPPIPHPTPFLLDNHLGRLARTLRLLGFDTRYPDGNHDDADLARMAHDEGRVLLTRDRGLLKRSLVVHGYCLRTRDAEAQLHAVLHRFKLHDEIRPWTRCLRCNGRLRPIAKDKISDRLEPKTKKYFHDFQICQACDQIYWQGSHFHKLAALVQRARDGNP